MDVGPEIRVTLATGEVLRYSSGWSVIGLYEDVQRRYPGAKITVELEDGLAGPRHPQGGTTE